MVAGKAAIVVPQLALGGQGEPTQALGRNRRADLLDMRHGPLGITPGLIADHRQLGDAILER
ncbi:MAG: hypothetical protein QM676_03935 [Novosphingobium sp.]